MILPNQKRVLLTVFDLKQNISSFLSHRELRSYEIKALQRIVSQSDTMKRSRMMRTRAECGNYNRLELCKIKPCEMQMR